MAENERWSSRAGFVHAAIGAAVGIGSIWKFPYEAGANGGGAFILCYLAGLILIVLPLMLAEVAIGRRGRAGPAESLAEIARVAGRSPHWRWVGIFGVLTGAAILSFYSVIGGWTLSYALQLLWSGLPGPDPESIRVHFDRHLADGGAMLVHHTLFMVATAMVVGAGVVNGIEAVTRVVMPVLIALLVVLACYAMITGDAPAALRFLFAPDLTRINARTAIDALGLGFFSIGVGLGFMVAYAAYAEREIDLGRVVFVTLLADTAISLVAGLAIFPIVFSHGLNPASGPGLMFVTLPIAFGQIPGGRVVAFVFYGLLMLSALASAISLLELMVAWLIRASAMSRRWAATLAAATCWIAGFATILSFGRWTGWHPIAFIPGFEHARLFDIIDYATSNLMLPVGGILFALFAGWIMPRAMLAEELRLGGGAVSLLRGALRYLLPILILIVLSAPFFLRG